MIQEITDKGTLDRLRKDYSKIFVSSCIPDYIFKDESWDNMFLSLPGIFDQSSYFLFQKFCKNISDEIVYITPIDFDSKIKGYHDLNLKAYVMINPIEIKIQETSFEEFDQKVHSKLGYDKVTDSVIWGSSKNWGMLNLIAADISILGYAKLISDECQIFQIPEFKLTWKEISSNLQTYFKEPSRAIPELKSNYEF